MIHCHWKWVVCRDDWRTLPLFPILITTPHIKYVCISKIHLIITKAKMSIVQVSASRCPSICERIIVSLLLAHYIRSSIFYRNEANWSENNGECNDNSILLFLSQLYTQIIIEVLKQMDDSLGLTSAYWSLCTLASLSTERNEKSSKRNQIESPATDTKF